MLISEASVIRAFPRKDFPEWKTFQRSKEFGSKCDSFWKEVDKLCILRELIVLDLDYGLVVVLEAQEKAFPPRTLRKVETLINRIFGKTTEEEKSEPPVLVEKVEEVKKRGRPAGSKNKK